MHPTPKNSICWTVVSLSLLLVFCNSGRREEPQQAKPSIKELKQKRLALLEQVCKGTKKLFERDRAGYAEVIAAEREQFVARLAYVDTQQDRIKACNQAIEDARNFLSIIQSRKASARATEVDVLRAQDFELQALIARAQAETSQ